MRSLGLTPWFAHAAWRCCRCAGPARNPLSEGVLQGHVGLNPVAVEFHFVEQAIADRRALATTWRCGHDETAATCRMISVARSNALNQSANRAHIGLGLL